MLKRCILCHPPRVGLITVQDNTMLKLLRLTTLSIIRLITVQDNTMLKLHVLHALRNKSLITVQDNTMLKLIHA